MLKDIKQLTKLYLHSAGRLPEGKSWGDFHDELIQNAYRDTIGLLSDANPKGKCKYALFVNVGTKTKTYEVRDYVEINTLSDWSSHLFWQGSGGRQSPKNAPHDYYDNKKFSTEDFITPLSTIVDNYCLFQEGKEKKKKNIKTGPLFWDKDRKDIREWLENIITILKENKDDIDKKVIEKFPALKSEKVFIGLTIDDKPIGEYEIFCRYLLFVRTRAGIKKGTDKFKYQIPSEVIKEFIGICPSCHVEKPLLNQWWGAAELSFYQMTYESLSSYALSSDTSYRLCQSCADLLFIFKQRLLKTLTRRLGGNECLVLPSIKLIPSDQNEKKRLYENLKGLWSVSGSDVASTEKRLLYRLGQLPSYATVTFIFGDYITKGKSQDVKRLDELNIIFPDVLPSRLSHISNVIHGTNNYLNQMWSLTGRSRNCTWSVRDDFQLLQGLFHPAWDEDKKNKDRNRKRYKSLRRPELERYLRAIFYGHEASFNEITEDCYSNLLSAFKTSRSSSKDDTDRYALTDYIGDVLSLMVFIYKLKNFSDSKQEVEDMTENTKFEFIAMPDLGKFIEMHPLFKDSQYLAPFFVGCLFSYAENLQKDNSRLAAYNWLGTMALSYEDILQDIYPKVLNYITNKEKLVGSYRLQELTKAIACYDEGKCDNDRVALVSFCHGWAVGRSFIMKQNIVNAIKKKIKELGMQMNDDIKSFMEANKEKINAKDGEILDIFLKLIPANEQSKISSIWQKFNKIKTDEGGEDNE